MLCFVYFLAGVKRDTEVSHQGVAAIPYVIHLPVAPTLCAKKIPREIIQDAPANQLISVRHLEMS